VAEEIRVNKQEFVCMVSLAMTFLLVAPCAEGGASKAGWWVRVEEGKTEASISLQIGTDKKDRHVWRTWHQGEETEFDVPEEYLQSQVLYIQAIANPDDKDSRFCVFFRENGVQQFDFDDQEDARMAQKDRDRHCK
jgi:hypothetical protein